MQHQMFYRNMLYNAHVCSRPIWYVQWIFWVAFCNHKITTADL